MKLYKLLSDNDIDSDQHVDNFHSAHNFFSKDTVIEKSTVQFVIDNFQQFIGIKN